MNQYAKNDLIDYDELNTEERANFLEDVKRAAITDLREGHAEHAEHDAEIACAFADTMLDGAGVEVEKDTRQMVRNIYVEVFAENDLSAVMTTSEVEETFSLAPGVARNAALSGSIPARKSGNAWLIRRADAVAKWGKRISKPAGLTLLAVTLAVVITRMM